MKIKVYLQILSGIGMLIAAFQLSAHPLLNESGNLTGGLLHPFSGLDHVIAMLAVSLWAVQRGAQFVWKIPFLFSLMLLAGAVLASTGIQLPLLETFIALSILVLGVLISLQPTVQVLVGMLMMTGFALYHGYAHGIALPAGAINIEYLTGLWLSTALIHGVGIGGGLILQRFGHTVLRWSGVPLLGLGSLLLLSV